MVIKRLMSFALVFCWLTGCTGEGLFAVKPLEPVLAAPPGTTAAAEAYKLGVGDIISIRVYDWRAAGAAPSPEDDLRIDKFRVDNGSVSLPFGEFKTVGQTLKQLELAIVDSLRGRLLRNPRVWVNIEEYRPFFVEGMVGRPGAYPYQPGLNVRKAIAIGGGLRERASLTRMFVVREGDPSNARARVNLDSPVGPGDTVTVNESFF